MFGEIVYIKLESAKVFWNVRSINIEIRQDGRNSDRKFCLRTLTPFSPGTQRRVEEKLIIGLPWGLES